MITKNNQLHGDIIGYAHSKGLTNCYFKNTIHSTLGCFYYGKRYICEINTVPEKDFQKEYETELERVKQWIDSFVDNLIIIRKKESKLPALIRAYIWIRRFIDPGYIYFDKVETKELDINNEQNDESPVSPELIFNTIKREFMSHNDHNNKANIDLIIRRLNNIDSFSKYEIKEYESEFYIVTIKISNNDQIYKKGFSTYSFEEITGMKLAKIIDSKTLYAFDNTGKQIS